MVASVTFMNSSYRLTKPFSIVHYRVYRRNYVGTLIRQSVLYSRGINKQQAPSRLFTTSSCAYVKSVHKFGRKFREKLLASEKIKMSGDSIEALAPLQAAVKEKGDIVRRLKEEKAAENDILIAVSELKAAKKILDDKVLELCLESDGHIIDRTKLEDLLKQRFFYDQAFSIYQGVAGLFDFGPMGCAMKANLLTAWRHFFVLEEQMLEVDSCMLTPEIVLKASGHVERFADYMVKDAKTGECFRADHLIEGHLEKMLEDKKVSEDTKAEIRALLPKIDGFNKEDMSSTIQNYNMKSPLTGNDLTEPMEFNLMFSTSIGPSGNLKGYLRPETHKAYLSTSNACTISTRKSCHLLLHRLEMLSVMKFHRDLVSFELENLQWQRLSISVIHQIKVIQSLAL